MDFFLINLLYGIQLSMLIFILAIGLTLIFGMMDTLNIAHGGFYTIGAYIGWLIASTTGSYWLAFIFAPLFVGLCGGLFQRFILQPLSENGRSTHLDFALLTFGLLFVIMGGAEIVFGVDQKTIEIPPLLEGSVPMFGLAYPVY